MTVSMSEAVTPIVGHGTHLPVGIFHHLDVSRSERGQECRPVALDAEDHEVRADAPRIERTGRGLRRPTGRDDAIEPGQRLREPAGVGVVLGQALDHAVRAVGEGHQAGRGQDPGLAHAATDHLARASGAPDDLARPDDHRSDRTGERLGEAERDGVGRVGQVGRANAQGDDRVPEPRAIDVERDAMGARDRADLAGVLGRQRLAHRMGVGVLERDQAGDRFVGVGGVAEGVLDLGRVDGAVGLVLERTHARPDDDRVTGCLVDDHVVLAAGDGLLAAREVRHLGDEVAHRPGGDEQAGLLAEQLGGALLEGVDRGVVAEDVVTELGVGHRPAHGRGRVGDGVAAQVDPWHGARV